MSVQLNSKQQVISIYSEYSRNKIADLYNNSFKIQKLTKIFLLTTIFNDHEEKKKEKRAINLIYLDSKLSQYSPWKCSSIYEAKLPILHKRYKRYILNKYQYYTYITKDKVQTMFGYILVFDWLVTDRYSEENKGRVPYSY